jgi:hypothetical protein
MQGETVKLEKKAVFIWLDRAARGEMVIFIVSLKNFSFSFHITLLCLSTATFDFYNLFLHPFTLPDFGLLEFLLVQRNFFSATD